MSSPDGANILVVDDDALVLESTCAVLSGHGFGAFPCNQSTRAVQRLSENAFDAVLSDIKMPGMTGLELLEAIKRADPEMPVVLVTAFADLNTAVDAIRRGAFDFILKPYEPDYLVLTTQKAVSYRRLLRIEKDYKKTLEDTVQKRTEELGECPEHGEKPEQGGRTAFDDGHGVQGF